ncbi:MAG: hypothetical protein O7H41_20170 [Planctomycetota bacterium]|nr:hypothetical protein [Planctomycetota bacterium]
MFGANRCVRELLMNGWISSQVSVRGIQKSYLLKFYFALWASSIHYFSSKEMIDLTDRALSYPPTS